MSAKKKRNIWILAVMLLSGCVQTDQLERLGLITAVGYDIEEGKLQGTYVIQQFDPTKQDVTQVITNRGYTSKGVRQVTNLETSNKVVSGQLRVILYGREIAKKGLMPVLDSLSRDAAIGTMVYVAISHDSTETILKTKPKTSNIGRYLY
jgi:spore germination protein